MIFHAFDKDRTMLPKLSALLKRHVVAAPFRQSTNASTSSIWADFTCGSPAFACARRNVTLCRALARHGAAASGAAGGGCSTDGIDRACPSHEAGSIAPTSCPARCAATFVPWWKRCKVAMAALDKSHAQQLSHFSAMCARTLRGPVGS